MHLPVSMLAAAAAVVAPVLGSPASPGQILERGGHHKMPVIERDVVILGGGSTGTYAAVHLQDRNHSVVVVEKKQKLGGHSETEYYHNGFVDMGVVAHFNDTLTKAYYERLGIPFENYKEPGKTQFVDFKTGKKLAAAPMGLNLSTIIPMYNKAIANYTYTANGTFNFPNPAPEELLEPFGKFLAKHPELKPALNIVYMFAQGVGDLLNTPLLYVLQNIGLVHVKAILGGLVAPTNGMWDLYDHAARSIGSENILYGHEAVHVHRGNGSADAGVTVVVQEGGPHGQLKMIKAKKLLVTIPPLLRNMKPFDLDATETSLFSKWQWKNYYVAIIANSGITPNISVTNFDPSQPSSLPVPPFQWSLQYLGAPGEPGYLASKLIADSDFSAADARKMMLGDIHRMNGTYPIRDPEIIAWDDHSPTTMSVSVDDIRDGFYEKLYALQGQRNTFYSGLSWCSDYSSVLWAYTESILDQMYPKM